MTEGEILARSLAGDPLRVRWRQSRLVALDPSPGPPEADTWLAPALVDLQINGFAGVDFQQDNLCLEELTLAALRLRETGCAAWLLTLTTDEWPRLMARLRHLRRLRLASPTLADAILGWHIEGPFLSAEPGYHGAHPAELMIDPTADHLRELRAATDADPVLLTLAPERKGALDAIVLATSLGFKVSLGHTNAPAEVLRRAVQAGATGFTHLGNACPVSLDRHDNILWRVLDMPGLKVSLIPDGIHVSPPLFRLAHRVLGSGDIYYVSDAVSAAGAAPGRYTVGPLTVEVGEDQVVRKPGSRQFAGSALRPIDCVGRAAQMLGGSWQQAWSRYSQAPLDFMGLGDRAGRTCCLLQAGSDAGITVLRTLERSDQG